jgi:cytochrome c-type biogenesis protein CcmE
VTRKQARFYGVLLLLLGVGAAAGLLLWALRDNVSYFRPPSEVVEGKYPEKASGRNFRLGGMVEEGSVHKEGDRVTFRVTDYAATVPVAYKGILPDLFREGQGVIGEGTMGADGVFQAERILAKHDEKYMPPEVAKTLKHKASEGGNGSGEGAKK